MSLSDLSDANPSAHLGILVHGFLHVLQQVVVGSALSLVDVDDAVQVGEVAVQVHPLSVAAAYEPVLYLSRLSGKTGGGGLTAKPAAEALVLGGVAHLRGGLLEAIGVHGGHEVDAGVVDEVNDGPVALLVLVAKVLSQVDEQLSAHGLIAVHVGHIFKLRLTCEEEK